MTKTRRAGFRKKRRRGSRKTVKRRGGRRRSRVTKRGGRRRSRGRSRRRKRGGNTTHNKSGNKTLLQKAKGYASGWENTICPDGSCKYSPNMTTQQGAEKFIKQEESTKPGGMGKWFQGDDKDDKTASEKKHQKQFRKNNPVPGVITKSVFDKYIKGKFNTGTNPYYGDFNKGTSLDEYLYTNFLADKAGGTSKDGKMTEKVYNQLAATEKKLFK